MSQQEGGESCEELLNLLHQRLISTGEWSYLLSKVRILLEESGWDAQLRQHAERTWTILTPGEAAAQESLHLTTFVDKLGAYAHGMYAPYLPRHFSRVCSRDNDVQAARLFGSKFGRCLVARMTGIAPCIYSYFLSNLCFLARIPLS